MQAAGLITFVTKDGDTPKTLGERVRWARKKRGLSQAALAKAAGVSQGMIGNLESGERQNPRKLLSIAKGLGAHAEWLESGKGEWQAVKGQVFKAPTPDEWELLEHWRHLLSKDKKAKLKEIADLAEERKAEKDELFEAAGVTAIMEKAAHASKTSRSRTTVDPANPALRQRALPFGTKE